ncbi:MAG: hypothetical protein ACYTJ0_18970 [Planctomycetota bacterium]|jgi:hypothetical protein
MTSFRITAPLLLACTMLLGGCFSFSGPNDIRNQITRSRDVTLERSEGVSVGPLGMVLARTFAGQYIPFDTTGVSSVDFGRYTILPASAGDADPLRLSSLDLPGWERVVRVRESGSDTVVMVEPDRLGRLLFLQRDGNELQIIRAKGRLDHLLEELLESELVDSAWPTGSWAKPEPEIRLTAWR